MKYLKLFENIESLQELSNEYLIDLIDKDYDISVSDKKIIISNKNIKNTIEDIVQTRDKYANENTYNETNYFFWDDIKDNVIPFIEILEEDYKINEVKLILVNKSEGYGNRVADYRVFHNYYLSTIKNDEVDNFIMKALIITLDDKPKRFYTKIKNFMKNIKTFESHSETKVRAGLIPYFNDNGVIKMLFFIPSDPAYGGDQPQIAKGRVDRGEDIQTAALREASEELGLKLSNVINTKLITKDLLSGMTANNYEFHLFASEVKSMEDFTDYGYETMETKWLTMEEFKIQGRETQIDLVQKAYNKI